MARAKSERTLRCVEEVGGPNVWGVARNQGARESFVVKI